MWAPFFERCFAVENPIPSEAPVIIITLFFISILLHDCYNNTKYRFSLTNLSILFLQFYVDKSKNTPFDGTKVSGKIKYTLYKGRVVYDHAGSRSSS